MFFARFSLSDSRCMSDAITSTKLEQTGEILWDSQVHVWVHGYLCFEPSTWKWNEGLPCLHKQVIVKKLLIDFVQIKPQYIKLDGLIVEALGDFLKTFLEGSMDHIIYRDYIPNRHSCIYCHLACVGTKPITNMAAPWAHGIRSKKNNNPKVFVFYKHWSNKQTNKACRPLRVSFNRQFHTHRTEEY